MKVTTRMLSCVLFHLILEIFMDQTVFFIAKKTERCFEVMKFTKTMSLVSAKLDLSQGL